MIAISADLKDQADRALQLSDFDSQLSTTLPLVDARKGTVLAFNASTGVPEAGPQIADVGTLAAITADITSLADIEDGTVSTDAISGLNAVKANVVTAAGIAANITTVAGISSNVTTVAGIASNVTTVAGIASSVTAAATNETNINTVGSNIANVNTVAGISANVTTVAGVPSDVYVVADKALALAIALG